MTPAAGSYEVKTVASRLNWLLMPLTVLLGSVLGADLTRWWLEVREAGSGVLAARVGRVAVLDDAEDLADLVRKQAQELKRADFVRYLDAMEHGSQGARPAG